MKRYNSKGYPIKVWIYTVAISPVLLMIFGAIVKSASIEMFINAIPAIFLLISFGFLFSLPAFLIYGLFYLLIYKLPYKEIVLKVIMSIIGLFVVGAWFYFLRKSLGVFRDDEGEVVIYLIVLVSSSFLLPLVKIEGSI